MRIFHFTSSNLQPLAASSAGGLVAEEKQPQGRLEGQLAGWLSRAVLLCVLRSLGVGLLFSVGLSSVILLLM